MRALRPVHLLTLVLVFGLLLTIPGGALAKNDKVIREEYTDDFTLENFCDISGFTVHITVEGTFRGTIHDWVIESSGPGSNDFWIGNFQDHGSAVYTNVATGESVTGTWRTNVKEASLTEIEGSNGFYEYKYAVNGIPVRLGGNLLKDRGHIVIIDTIYLGDLSTTADDYFVSGIATHIAGPHPAYDSTAFCDALYSAIG